jgi:hypothetical protein
MTSMDMAELRIAQGTPHAAEHEGSGYHSSYRLDDRKNWGM